MWTGRRRIVEPLVGGPDDRLFRIPEEFDLKCVWFYDVARPRGPTAVDDIELAVNETLDSNREPRLTIAVCVSQARIIG